MSRSPIVTTCDCGCGKTALPFELELWLTLSQHPERRQSVEPKLGRDGGASDLQFATISCLTRWCQEALKIIPKMVTLVRGGEAMYPRSRYSTPEFPTLWF